MDESALEKVSFERTFGRDFHSTIPKSPGVYFFWDEAKNVIYIGKAKNLSRRLGQYKNASRMKKHAKMRLLVKEAAQITWVTCDTDLQASRDEISLIQQYKPKHNISSKFSFMYPYIGIRLKERTLELLLTTIHTELNDFEVYGAFRSNRKTRDAFFSLVKLMQMLYRNQNLRTPVSYTHRILFEKVDAAFVTSLKNFLNGKEEGFLSELTLKLVDKAMARVRSEFVQDSIDNLKKFFTREARRLHRVKTKAGFDKSFVSQEERDVLFLNERV